MRRYAFLLAGSGFDTTANHFVAGAMNPEAEYLFSTSRLAVLNANIQGYLGELKTVFRDSTDYLDRLIDIPQVDLLACAWFANSKYDPTVLLDVETPITSRSLFRWTMLAPDSAATSKVRATAGGDRDAQILMGELPENLDKVDTSLRAGTNFLAYGSFLTLLANISAVISSFYVVLDPNDFNHPANPPMWRFARKVAFELSAFDSRLWLKHNSAQSRHAFCWWVSILDQFTRLTVTLVRNPKHVLYFGEKRYDDLPSSWHRDAFTILDDAIDRWRKITRNVETVPTTSIATAWETNHVAKADSKRPDGAAKRTKSLEDDKHPAAKKARSDELVDKSGPLVYTGEQRLMPSPSLQPSDRICAANARDGYVCRHHNCKFIHEKDVTKWPPTAFAEWKKMVESTPGLAWNPALVEPKVIGMKLASETKQVSAPTSNKK
jgi:hypothetical protein